MMKDPEKSLGNMIDKSSTAIISSIDEEGFPNIKAMLACRKREGIKIFYFTTNTSSKRIRQYRNNPKAGIYFYDKRFFRGVQFLGTMEVLEDSFSKEMIWLAGDEIYYPKGVTDSDYCVLRFTAVKGRYYSNFKTEEFKIV